MPLEQLFSAAFDKTGELPNEKNKPFDQTF
jgi:hypothetical protein